MYCNAKFSTWRSRHRTDFSCLQAFVMQNVVEQNYWLNKVDYNQLREQLEVSGFGVTWLGRGEKRGRKKRREEALMRGDGRKYLGYTAEEVARPSVRKVD